MVAKRPYHTLIFGRSFGLTTSFGRSRRSPENYENSLAYPLTELLIIAIIKGVKKFKNENKSMATTAITTQSVTVQAIAKILNKAGLAKAKFERVNFQDVAVGNYEARHLKIYGLNTITVTPKNGTTCQEIEAVLNLQGIKTQSVRGIVTIL